MAPDLPGHGFTDAPSSSPGYSLPGVANGLGALFQVLNLKPALAVGHSAGAAVALRMMLDSSIIPAAVVSLNGALLSFPAWPEIFSARQLGYWRAPASPRKRFRYSPAHAHRLSGCCVRPAPGSTPKAYVCMLFWLEILVTCRRRSR